MRNALEFQQVSLRYGGSGVSVRRGAVLALDGLSLGVAPGQVFGFIGPNGAGKTTAIQVLLGFLPPSTGTATVFGLDVRDGLARRRLGYMPENAAFYPLLTAVELMRNYARFFNLPSGLARDRAAALLEEVGLGSAAHRRLGTYSRGMLQRFGMAQALINDPDLIILDEPTSGMDPLGRMDVRAMIGRWKRMGKTVFFSSHELSEVERVCDEVALLARGRVVAQGAPETLTRPGESLEQFFLRAIGGRPDREERP